MWVKGVLCTASPRPVEETMTEKKKTEKVVKAAALTTVEAGVGAAACAVALMRRYLAAMEAADQEVLIIAARDLTIE